MKIRPHPEIYFDYTPEEQKDIVDRIVNNIRSNGEPFEETITLLPENMDKKFVRIKGSPIKDKKNHIVKMVGVDLDITEHLNSAREVAHLNKKLQERHKELETLNSELKTFNNITSSDYKDTLQFLYTNLEYIATTEARRLGDSAKANIRRAQATIQRMKLLTSDITGYLQLYEIGVNKTLIDPNPILNDVITGMNKKILDANASIELTALPYLYADPFLFSLLMKHLLDNAIKFRRVAPAMMIKIKYSRADEINNIPGALPDTPYTLISISDNGVGFPEENTERVFELFSRLHGKQYPGSGIGLAICKKIMAMHQGLISAESTAGVGTTFICYFPEDVNM